MAYPSVLSTLATPQPTDRLSSPSHSTLHQNENSAILEIERAVGLDSSILGTVIGDLRNPLSNGGGHVQTANKGGTGQTTFNKGDLLVGQNSSTLTKLAIGADNLVLQTDSSQAVGVKWGAAAASKIAVQSSTVGGTGTSVLTTFFNASVIGSTLGTNNAIRVTAVFSNLNSGTSGTQASFKLNYGNNVLVSTGSNLPSGGLTATKGFIDGLIVGNGSANAQKASMRVIFTDEGSENTGQANVGITKFMIAGYGTGSVVSSANQNLSISVQTDQSSSILGEFIVVEKIV